MPSAIILGETLTFTMKKTNTANWKVLPHPFMGEKNTVSFHIKLSHVNQEKIQVQRFFSLPYNYF